MRPGWVLALTLSIALSPFDELCASPALIPPIHWKRFKGPPNDECFRPHFDIHVRPAFSLHAVANDQTMSWVIAADERGLDILVCKDKVIQGTSFAGPIAGDPNIVVMNTLQEMTTQFPPADWAGHADEVRGLQAELIVSLPQLIRDARKRYPGFLEKPPVSNIPTP